MFRFVVVREDRAVHPFSDVFYSDFYADGVTEDYFVKLKERVQGEQTVEIMVHPAYIDPELVKRSSYVMDRVKELRILTESELPEGIELVKFNRKTTATSCRRFYL